MSLQEIDGEGEAPLSPTDKLTEAAFKAREAGDNARSDQGHRNTL